MCSCNSKCRNHAGSVHKACCRMAAAPSSRPDIHESCRCPPRITLWASTTAPRCNIWFHQHAVTTDAACRHRTPWVVVFYHVMVQIIKEKAVKAVNLLCLSLSGRRQQSFCPQLHPLFASPSLSIQFFFPFPFFVFCHMVPPFITQFFAFIRNASASNVHLYINT